MFARKSVSEFVEDLGGTDGQPQINQVGPSKKRVKLGKTAAELRKLRHDQSERRQHEGDAQGDDPRPQDPRDITVKPREGLLGIPSGQAQIQEIAGSVPESLPAL